MLSLKSLMEVLAFCSANAPLFDICGGGDYPLDNHLRQSETVCESEFTQWTMAFAVCYLSLSLSLYFRHSSFNRLLVFVTF